MLRSDVAGASPEYVDYFLFLPLVVQCIFCIHANGKKKERERILCKKSDDSKTLVLHNGNMPGIQHAFNAECFVFVVYADGL